MGSLLSKIIFKTGSESLTKTSDAETFFDFKVNDIDGKPVDLGEYRKKTKCFIIVNVACK